MISKALLVLFFATVYQCYFFLGLCQSTVSGNSQCLNRRDDCYKDNSCSFTFTLPRSDGENCPALRDTLMDLHRVKTRLGEQELRLDEQEIRLEEQQLRLDGQERLLEEQQRLINELEEKTYDYMCSTIGGISLKFKNYLNLTTATSDITETSEVLSFDSFTSNHTYLLVVTLKELYVYQVFGGEMLRKVQSISSVGSYSYWNGMSGTGSFEIDGQYFFILNSYTPDSLGVYRWDGTQLVEDDVIIYQGYGVSLRWSFFESTFYNEYFLANAVTSATDITDNLPSFVYKLNGSHFVYLQDINTSENTFVVRFLEVDNNELFLLLGSWYSPSEFISFVYKYNASISEFVYHQALPVSGVTSDMLIFDMDRDTFLMHTMSESSTRNPSTQSPLYKWNMQTSMFDIQQVFNTTSARSACHVRYCDQHFLVIVSQESDSIVYKLENGFFVQYQILDNYRNTGLYSCHAFHINDNIYLVVDKVIYRLV